MTREEELVIKKKRARRAIQIAEMDLDIMEAERAFGESHEETLEDARRKVSEAKARLDALVEADASNFAHRFIAERNERAAAAYNPLAAR